MTRRLRSLFQLACVAGLGAAAIACRERGPTPLLVIGIDGGEWRMIRQLWASGELPNLRALASAGTSATLRTAYNASPVIWTTIATGVTPREHGITNFVVPGPNGDVPISSAVRKVPALWSMLSRVHKRVAVVGWWGSWPAEEVDGVVVSDRALLDLESRVYPPTYLGRFKEAVERAKRESGLFNLSSEAELRDAAMAAAGQDLLREQYDLTLLYFRSADIVSHHEWREDSTATPPIGGAEVSRIYRALDRAVGEVLAAAGRRNVLVISDHGFRAARTTEIRTLSDFDAALVHLGYQTRNAHGVDFGRSLLYCYGSPQYMRKKLVRFAAYGREPGAEVSDSQRAGILSRLDDDLARIRYGDGSPVFLLRPATPREGKAGADFVVLLSPDRASTDVRIDGVPVKDVVLEVSRLSGTHDAGNDGILIAAGPDIQAGAAIEGIRVHDITPTVLFGLNLPVADNFAGKAWPELFRPEYRARYPLRSIRTWGTSRSGSVRQSAADGKLMQELRSLGYIR